MRRRLIPALFAALTLAAIGTPGAFATVDLRSPDARDAAAATTRDTSTPISIDLRSPDASDVARGRDRRGSVLPPVEASSVPASGWFNWASAAIGVGAFALLLMGAAGMRTGARRMRGHVAT